MLAELEREAREAGRTRSEHVRDVLESHTEHEANTGELQARVDALEAERDDLQERLDARESRVDDLEAERDDLQERLTEHGGRVDDLQERLDARESRVEDLEAQLRERSRVEEKIEDLPDKIRDTDTYQERRRRLLDEASLGERLKWKVTGVPVDRLDDGDGRA
jgi:chromosome segregation protein